MCLLPERSGHEKWRTGPRTKELTCQREVRLADRQIRTRYRVHSNSAWMDGKQLPISALETRTLA